MRDWQDNGIRWLIQSPVQCHRCSMLISLPPQLSNTSSSPHLLSRTYPLQLLCWCCTIHITGGDWRSFISSTSSFPPCLKSFLSFSGFRILCVYINIAPVFTPQKLFVAFLVGLWIFVVYDVIFTWQVVGFHILSHLVTSVLMLLLLVVLWLEGRERRVKTGSRRGHGNWGWRGWSQMLVKTLM